MKYVILLLLIIIIVGVFEVEDNSNNVGERVVIDRDTLTIVDYSSVFNTYILSDGGEVHENFIEDNIIR